MQARSAAGRGRCLRTHHDRVPHPEAPADREVDQVLPEIDVLRRPRIAAVGRQGTERLDAPFPRRLVRRRDRAAGAGARRPELNRADPQARPGVLGERRATLDDQVGAEAVPPQRLLAPGDQPVVEVRAGWKWGRKESDILAQRASCVGHFDLSPSRATIPRRHFPKMPKNGGKFYT